jgi:hypothetical protein
MAITKRSFYEWDAEEVQIEDEDILDHDHGDIGYVLAKESTDPAVRIDRCLVKDVFEVWDGEIDGLVHRAWAYIEDGKLPEFFDDGSRVPARFHEQLRKALLVTA